MTITKAISYFLAHDDQRSWDLMQDHKSRRSCEPVDPATGRAYRRIMWVFDAVYDNTGLYSGTAARAYAISRTNRWSDIVNDNRA